jgi:hypothetical protein
MTGGEMLATFVAEHLLPLIMWLAICSIPAGIITWVWGRVDRNKNRYVSRYAVRASRTNVVPEVCGTRGRMA